MTTNINNHKQIISSNGNSPINSYHSLSFPGYIKLSPIFNSTIESISFLTQSSVRGVFITSSIVLSISPLCTNGFTFVSKLIQIIEFSALMEFYNFNIDVNLGTFLRCFNELLEFNILESPTASYVPKIQYSKAGQWKGKLSEADTKPTLLQELGYPGILLMVRILKFNF